MEMGTEKKKEYREITYQVGWKKGKIEWQERPPEPSGPSADQAKAAADEREPLLRAFWKAAPPLPRWLLLPLLAALPVSCFALTLLLVYMLRSA